MLLVDLGNTRGKLVGVQGDKLLAPVFWDYQQSVLPIVTELNPSSIVIASVAPEPIFQQLLRAANEIGVPLTRVTTQRQAGGITNGYKDYQRLGVDRWLAMIGARQLSQQACIVVDAGTAVTVDVLDDAGQHLGGWILPGLCLMQQALIERSNQLQISEPPHGAGFGVSTSDAIQLGARYAVVGAIEQALRLLSERENEQVATIMVTGGDADMLVPLVTGNSIVVPDLVVRGLYCMAHGRN